MASPDGSSAARDPRLHHDALAARRVFVAPDRESRPHDHAAGVVEDAAGRCPFCAGNESWTPPTVLRCPADPALPWRSRIVPNRYPVAVDAAAAGRGEPTAHEAAAIRPAHGVHEVVIESAAHERTILAVEPPAWREVWALCRARLEALAARADLAWATVFKNSGPGAGASLEHLHSQLVAIDFVPPFMEAEIAAAADAVDPFGRLIASARAEGRIVMERADLVALVPPAPRQPYETWILPCEPEPYFHGTGADRVAALADLTRDFVARLQELAPTADYNWWLHQLPFGRHAGDARLATTWHWHLEILPRLTPFAGFELGTGCHVTTVAPEEAARRLRGR